MKSERLQIYDHEASAEYEVRGYRQGRQWFYESGAPMGSNIEVLMIKGYRDRNPQRAARSVQNPYAPEYEYESKPPPPPPPRRGEEDWRKHLGYPPEGMVNPHQKLIRTTYDILTPESAERGDADRRGWIDEEGEDMVEFDEDESPVDNAIRFLEDAGVIEASATHFHPGVWYTNREYGHGTRDYFEKGIEESRSYHLDGFSDAEEREVFDAIAKRQNPHEFLDDEEDEVELVGLVAERYGYTGDVHDHIDKQIATDWIEERTGIPASDLTSKLPDREVTKWLVENLDLPEDEAQYAAEMMSKWEKHGAGDPYNILRWIDDRIASAGVKEIVVGVGGEIIEPAALYDYPQGFLAKYIDVRGRNRPTVLFDYDEDKFYLITCGDWVERWERRRGAARMYIKLDNMEDREGAVMITMTGEGAGKKAKDDQSIAGSHWEIDGDFAYAMPEDYPELLEDLEADGYDVDASEYTPPEYEVSGEHYDEGYDE